MLFMTNLFNEKEKRIGLSLTIYRFLLHSNFNNGLAHSSSRFTEYGTQRVYLRARIRRAFICQQRICGLFLLPDLPWNPTKSNRTHVMWPFLLRVLHRQTIYLVALLSSRRVPYD